MDSFFLRLRNTSEGKKILRTLVAKKVLWKSVRQLLQSRHSPKGQELLTYLLAMKYVRRGGRWLNRNAQKGWWRNCMNGGDSRIHMSYSSEGILGIVFEYCREFADSSGYINEGKVLRHFGFHVFSEQACRLGFEAGFGGYKPFKRYTKIVITDKILDVSWSRLLKNPPADWRIPYRHPTEWDEKFARMVFSGNESHFSLRRLLRNFFRPFQATA